MPWPSSSRSMATAIGIPALVIIIVVAAVAAVNRTIFAATWFCLKTVCCTDSKIVPERSAARKRHHAVHNEKIKKLEKRLSKRQGA